MLKIVMIGFGQMRITHYPILFKTAQNNIHVFLEKPCTTKYVLSYKL